MARGGSGQAAPAGDTGRADARLLERESELATLSAALDRAIAGEGSVVVLEGAAGVGKTRLLAAVRDDSRARGLTAFDARAADLDQDVALRVATQLLAPALANRTDAERDRALAGVAGLARGVLTGAETVGPPVDPGALTLALYWATANLVDGTAAVMTIDDVQWADQASLRYLVHLAAHADELPLAIVVALRTGEPASGATELLDRLRAERAANVMTIHALSDAAVAELVAAEFPGADPDPFMRATGGNPFLLRELVQALHSENADADNIEPRLEQLVPDSVLRFALVRLGQLGHDAAQLARAAAILGDGASLSRTAALAQLDEQTAAHAADALAAAHILEAGGPLRFKHALLRAAILSDLPRFERAGLHRAAADLLKTDGEGADAVAAHLLATEPAGDPATVAGLRDAAQLALRRGDPGAAKRILARACAEPPPPNTRGDVLAELARAEVIDADPAAQQHFTDALETLDDPVSRATALAELGGVLYVLNEQEQAAATAERALEEIPPDHPAAETLLATYLSVTSFHAALRPGAVKHAKPLMDAARAGRLPTDPGLLAHVTMGLALGGDSPAIALEAAERAMHDDPLVVPGTHGLMMGFVLHSLIAIDELDTVDRMATQAMDAALEVGSTIAFANASSHRALSNYHRGNLDEALADIDQALRPREMGWTQGDGWTGEMQIRVHLDRGDLTAARAALELANHAAPDSMDLALVLNAKARLALAENDPATALQLAEQSGRHLIDAFDIDPPGFVAWRGPAARAAHALGDSERARKHASDYVARARETQVPRAIGAALHTAGIVADHEDAIPLLRDALDALDASPSTLERARTLISLGSALRKRGHRAECRQPLLEGLELADAMRAQPLADRARTELETVGARPRRTALSGLDSLTPTERRVAGLAALGASNPELAQALFVTVKTIETHLSRVYRKLGITRRSELPDALRP